MLLTYISNHFRKENYEAEESNNNIIQHPYNLPLLFELFYLSLGLGIAFPSFICDLRVFSDGLSVLGLPPTLSSFEVV